jgi:hypothetical protein
VGGPIQDKKLELGRIVEARVEARTEEGVAIEEANKDKYH